MGIELHSTASSGAQRLPMTANSALRHNGSAQQRGEIKRGIHLSVVRETDAEPFRVVAIIAPRSVATWGVSLVTTP